MLKIERTGIVDRYNLINDEAHQTDEDRYIRQIGKEELKELGKSIIDVLE